MTRGIALPTALRWRLLGNPGPSLGRALVVGESLRAAVMLAGNRIGMDALPMAFHGPGSDGAHDHAYWLSEDRDGDGLIDHLLVFARSGLSPLLLQALCGAERIFLSRSAEWSLLPVWMGCPFAEGSWRAGRVWHSVTPYVTPRWQRVRAGEDRATVLPDAQLRWEIRQRGLPDPVAMTWRVPEEVPWLRAPSSTVEIETRSRRPPPGAAVGFPMIEFPKPVEGPLAFGFGAHFGLGLLAPTG